MGMLLWSFLALFALVSCASSSSCSVISGISDISLSEEWENYKLEFGKSYSSEVEERLRFKIFQYNRQRVSAHNLKYLSGNLSYSLRINQFSDLRDHEFKRVTSCLLAPPRTKSSSRGSTFLAPHGVELPRHVDWREAGAVTPVKNQGTCGSCWSFAATGAVEGQHYRKTGKLVSLSEQNLIDCSGGSFENLGCAGGWSEQAFKYIEQNGGIDTEDSYPYEDKSGLCRYNPLNSGAQVTGFTEVTPRSVKDLMSAVATVGPVAVGIYFIPALEHYAGGVFSSSACSSSSLLTDHAVLVVGYGTDPASGMDYWLVKNSWGETWGEGGYLKLRRGKDNLCGILNEPTFPQV